MAAFRSDVDPDGLQEFSVVFTDRSLNHMSRSFQEVMRGISATLRKTYGADAVALVPGGGSYAMEAVARQFATGQRALVIRNGWFSYRWSQILEAGGIATETAVAMARAEGNAPDAPFAPAPIAEVVARIAETRPDVVFAPHVETASGMILPEGYLAEVAKATHAAGGLFVLDCIASGCVWLDMKALGIDILISAPQKGWSASPSAGMVMFSEAALARLETTVSSSFALDLKKWLAIMRAYETGGHAYHATMPTDALAGLYRAMIEAEGFGMARLKEAQWRLGDAVRATLAKRGVRPVAAKGFGAPGVVVAHTADADIQNGKRFAAEGLQIAAGVPLQIGEPEGYRSFRIGLFGLDKLRDVEGTLARLAPAFDKVLGPEA